ncbi:MAG: SpoIIE family protein phosphatase [Bacteroidales bacterium]|nr:SpoIIE family protein phosphatase [Bacteroidales bacterium]
MKQRNIIGRFLTANLKGEIFDGDVRKAVIINLFSIVGIISLLYFFSGGLLTHRWGYSAAIAVFLILTIGTLIMFQKLKNTKLASTIIVSLMLLLEIALLTKLGESTTGLFWFYLFPMLAFFMLGKKAGLFFSLLLLVLGIILIRLNIEGITQYPRDLHERFIITYLVTSLLAFIFENIRNTTFNAFITADKEKSEYLEETLQQKEEIQTQAELLLQKNIELEQLSIAASETDNSIIIADAKTNIEWVNKGFTKMLQLSLKEFKEMCPTLLECSENKNKIKQSISEKRSITYFSHFTLKDDSKIWLQSTVTPVLDHDQNVIKLVIVESDITLQKLAEQEIKEKNEELNQQKNELVAKNDIILEKNEAIRHSIEYALTIQRSILPNLKSFNEKFENFILYKPKDIVSGDFFWLSSVENTCIAAVIDCTGHGVPGAFMSILGSRILDEIVNFKKIISPAKILDELNKQVITSLHQKNSNNKDGMDVIICQINNEEDKNKNITFCGAKRPFIYFDSEKKKTISIKGIRKSIGGFQSELNTQKFTDTQIKIPKNSYIYLTSDGYIDQHNPLRRRIGTKNLTFLLKDISEKRATEQINILKEFKNNWQQNEMQTDDITIWGIKIN